MTADRTADAPTSYELIRQALVDDAWLGHPDPLDGNDLDRIAEVAARAATTTERQRIERAIRDALPGLLVDEYGETEADWRELRSIARIARILAEDITKPRVETPSV